MLLGHVHHNRDCCSGRNNRPYSPLHSPSASTLSKPGYSSWSRTRKDGNPRSDPKVAVLVSSWTLRRGLRLRLERTHVAHRAPRLRARLAALVLGEWFVIRIDTHLRRNHVMATLPGKPIVVRTFSLDDISDAHRYMESNQHIGKIVVLT